MPFACTVGIPDPSRSVEHSVPWSLVCRDGRRLARVPGLVSDRSWGDAGDPLERVAKGRLRAVAELRGELADGDRGTGQGSAAGSELPHLGDPDHGQAGRVRGREVDLRADAPVVIAGRVVEDLPYRPPARLLVDDQEGRAAGVGAGADLVVLGEVRLDGLRPGVGVPAGLGIQLAQLLVPAQGRKLDPAEQRVAD